MALSQKSKTPALAAARSGENPSLPPPLASSGAPKPTASGVNHARPHHTDLDRLVHAAIVRSTAGRSPISPLIACIDWISHLALAPGLQQHLAALAAERMMQLWRHALQCGLDGSVSHERCIEPLPQDKRFADPAWSQWPFNFIHQAFLMQQDWWQQATTGVPGVSPRSAATVSFLTRQLLDMWAPSNFVATNPVVLRKTMETGGRNLYDGAINLLEDARRAVSNLPPVGTDAFKVGETIACTPGAVIFRNDLIELIQYKPQTATVHPEPVLFVPAWIMKYYILDLSPQNSLVRHLVQAGHTVFMVSWRNPGPEQHDLGMEDYLTRGVEDAIAAVKAVIPDYPIHAVGYCLGGTLLAIAAAHLASRSDKSLKTLTLLAAQTDFADAGELTLFIDESQITFLEDLMWQRGILEARQMAGAFRLLRSNDLIWSRVVRDYLLGTRSPVTDIMAWNADATRMPYRMHSEYLRHLFLDNDLAAGRYVVKGSPIGLSNIDVPIFVVATAWDHVAPWKSVYKIHLQADVDVTFALTTGGHNVGVVSPPGAIIRGREYRIGTHLSSDAYVSPDQWLKSHDPVPGSWWPAWFEWLREKSSTPIAPPATGAANLEIPPGIPAPGDYVFDR